MGSDIAQDAGVVRSAVLRWALDWLYPPRCLSCEAPVADPGGLCPECWRSAVFLAGSVCRRCGALDPYAFRPRPSGRALDFERRCHDCPPRPVAFTEARAAMAYVGPGRRLPLALKHRDRFDMARAMGAWMARAGADLRAAAPALGPPLIAPAPLHWRRRIARRGDQAAALARVVAERWGAALIEGAVRRTRATPPQAGLDDAAARWRNIGGAFVAPEAQRARFAGRRVVLIDDVMTTGATLDACAAALRAAGAARVDALVFARPCKAALDAIGLLDDSDGHSDAVDHAAARRRERPVAIARAPVALGAADATSRHG